MPPKRDPRRDQAAKMFVEHGGKIDLVEIARRLDVPASTVRAWRSKDKNAWATGTERSEKQTERSAPARPKAAALKTADDEIAQALDEADGLTEKQRLFCFHLMKNWNATQAAINAGYYAPVAGQLGYQLLQKPLIQQKIKELKRIRNAYLPMAAEDLIEMHMRIVGADMTDFVRFGVERRPQLYKGKPVYVENPKKLGEDGKPEKQMLAFEYNTVWLRDSSEVDGNLISEVTQTKDGAKIKLRNPETSLKFLERYFEANPLDQHRMAFERRRLEIELMKIESAKAEQDAAGETARSNFDEAMQTAAQEVWGDSGDDDADENE